MVEAGQNNRDFSEWLKDLGLKSELHSDILEQAVLIGLKDTDGLLSLDDEKMGYIRGMLPTIKLRQFDDVLGRMRRSSDAAKKEMTEFTKVLTGGVELKRVKNGEVESCIIYSDRVCRTIYFARKKGGSGTVGFRVGDISGVTVLESGQLSIGHKSKPKVDLIISKPEVRAFLERMIGRLIEEEARRDVSKLGAGKAQKQSVAPQEGEASVTRRKSFFSVPSLTRGASFASKPQNTQTSEAPRGNDNKPKIVPTFKRGSTLSSSSLPKGGAPEAKEISTPKIPSPATKTVKPVAHKKQKETTQNVGSSSNFHQYSTISRVEAEAKKLWDESLLGDIEIKDVPEVNDLEICISSFFRAALTSY